MKKCREQPMHFMKNGKRDVKILYPTDILIAIHLKNLCRQMIQEFDQIETLDVKKIQESESLEKSL